MTTLALPKLWVPRFEPWRLLRPLCNIVLDGVFAQKQRLQMEGGHSAEYSVAAGGGPAVVTYIGVQSRSGTLGATETFTAEGIGADVAKLLVFAAGTGRGGGNARSISGITVGGVSMTVVQQASGTDSSEAGTYGGIWQLVMTGGTSADVIVTFSASGAEAVGLGKYAITAYVSSTSTGGFGAADTAGTDPVSLDHNTPASGAVISMGINTRKIGNTARSYTWTGPTENQDALIQNSDIRFSSASAVTTAQTPMTITADLSGTPDVRVDCSAAWN